MKSIPDLDSKLDKPSIKINFLNINNDLYYNPNNKINI